jgi:hypothetical protein
MKRHEFSLKSVYYSGLTVLLAATVAIPSAAQATQNPGATADNDVQFTTIGNNVIAGEVPTAADDTNISRSNGNLFYQDADGNNVVVNQSTGSYTVTNAETGAVVNSYTAPAATNTTTGNTVGSVTLPDNAPTAGTDSRVATSNGNLYYNDADGNNVVLNQATGSYTVTDGAGDVVSSYTAPTTTGSDTTPTNTVGNVTLPTTAPTAATDSSVARSNGNLYYTDADGNNVVLNQATGSYTVTDGAGDVVSSYTAPTTTGSDTTPTNTVGSVTLPTTAPTAATDSSVSRSNGNLYYTDADGNNVVLNQATGDYTVTDSAGEVVSSYTAPTTGPVDNDGVNTAGNNVLGENAPTAASDTSVSRSNGNLYYTDTDGNSVVYNTATGDYTVSDTSGVVLESYTAPTADTGDTTNRVGNVTLPDDAPAAADGTGVSRSNGNLYYTDTDGNTVVYNEATGDYTLREPVSRGEDSLPALVSNVDGVPDIMEWDSQSNGVYYGTAVGGLAEVAYDTRTGTYTISDAITGEISASVVDPVAAARIAAERALSGDLFDSFVTPAGAPPITEFDYARNGFYYGYDTDGNYYAVDVSNGLYYDADPATGTLIGTTPAYVDTSITSLGDATALATDTFAAYGADAYAYRAGYGGPAECNQDYGAGTLGQLICNTLASFENTPGLLSGASYLFGIILGFLGIWKLKEHVESPNSVPIWDPIKRFIAGGAFLALPWIIDAAYVTITGEASPLGILTGSDFNTDGVSGGGLDALLVALIGNIWQPMQGIMTGFAWLAGLILIIIGISRLLRSEQEGPRGPMGIGTIMTFLVAGVLLSLNNVLGAAVFSIFRTGSGASQNDATLTYTDGMSAAAAGHADAVIGAIMAFVAILGWISFIRGFFIMRGVAEGNSQASMMAGVTHIIGGAVAVNLGGFIEAVQVTLGITNYGLTIN